MNSVLQYQLPTFTGLLRHGSLQTLFVRDEADEQPSVAGKVLEAQVKSGDYFVMLATALDQLGRETDDAHVRMSLEDVVSDLIYLQDNYVIEKNDPSK